jgi:hypothetical protein
VRSNATTCLRDCVGGWAAKNGGTTLEMTAGGKALPARAYREAIQWLMFLSSARLSCADMWGVSGLRVWRGLLAVLLGVGVLTGSFHPAVASTTNNGSSIVGGTSTGPNVSVVTSVRYDGGGDTPISQTVDGVNGWFSHDPLNTVTDLASSAGVMVADGDPVDDFLIGPRP